MIFSTKAVNDQLLSHLNRLTAKASSPRAASAQSHPRHPRTRANPTASDDELSLWGAGKDAKHPRLEMQS